MFCNRSNSAGMEKKYHRMPIARGWSRFLQIGSHPSRTEMTEVMHAFLTDNACSSAPNSSC